MLDFICTCEHIGVVYVQRSNRYEKFFSFLFFCDYAMYHVQRLCLNMPDQLFFVAKVFDNPDTIYSTNSIEQITQYKR